MRFLNKRTVLALSISTAISLSLTPSFNAGADSSVEPQEQISFNSQIVDAAENSDFALMSALLSTNANPNEKGDFGTTALIRAAYHGSKDIAEMLLKKGANPNQADIGGATPLHIAARQGNKEIAALLVQYGAKIDQADKEGNTPLMAASANNSAEIVALLADRGSNVNKTNQQGESALIYAADSKNADAVKHLVEKGADTKIIDQEGSNLASISDRKGGQIANTIGKENLPASEPEIVESKTLDLADSQPNRIDWFEDLKKVFGSDKGSLELASVTNYQPGNKYIILDMGSFKTKDLADKKAAELKEQYKTLLGNTGVAVIEKNGALVVNAGIFDNNAEAQRICKIIVIDNGACRIIETTMLDKDTFTAITSSPIAAAPKSATAEVKDDITPSPVAKVDAKEVNKPAPENIASALVPASPVAPAATQAAQEEKKSVKELAEMTKAPIAPAGKPVATALVTPKDQDDMRSLIDTINSQTPPEPAKKPEIKPAPEAAKAVEVPKKVEKTESSFDRLKSLIGQEEKPVAKPEIKVSDNKEKVEPKIIKPFEPTPSLEKAAAPAIEKKPAAPETKVASATMPEIELPETAHAKTEIPKAELPKTEAPKVEPVAEPVKEKAEKPTEKPAEKLAERSEKPVEKKVEQAAVQKPKIVKIPEEKISPVAPVIPAGPVVAAVPEIAKKEAEPKKEVAQEVKQEVKKELSAPVNLITPPIIAEKPKPVILVINEKPAEKPVDKFKVSTPIKVEERELPPVSVATAPTVSLSPQTYFSRSGQFWVKIDSFDTEDDVFAFWKNVSAYANTPNAGAIAVHSGNVKKYIAQIGPFNSNADTAKFCEAITAYGDDNGQNLRCMSNRVLPNARSYDRYIGGLSSGTGRHSDLKSTNLSQLQDFNDNSNSTYSVQIGSFTNATDAHARWEALKSQIASLKKLEPNLVAATGEYSAGKIYLRTSGFDSRAKADDLCGALRQKMISCIIVKA